MKKKKSLITNLEELCRIKVVHDAVESGQEVDIQRFTDGLNHFIHDFDDEGYDYAEKCNLKMDKKYTKKEAEELLDKIQKTRKLDKNALYIAEIDEVPYGISYELSDSAGGGAYTNIDARNAKVKLGMLRGHELVGFVSGDYGRNLLSIRGLYIREDYREKGLSKILLGCMMNKARRKKLDGLWMGNASWQGADALHSLKKHYDRLGVKVEFESGSEDLRNYAGLYFKKAGKRNE